MPFGEVALLSVTLLLGAVFIHYESLQVISRHVRRLPRARIRMVYVVLGTLTAHLLEIALYAVGYRIGYAFGIGTINGSRATSIINLFYFSAETFTSLGFGDVYPTSYLRLLAGIECLNGFTLIGWSTSFTYLSMRDFWEPSSGKRPPSPLGRERQLYLRVSSCDRRLGSFQAGHRRR